MDKRKRWAKAESIINTGDNDRITAKKLYSEYMENGYINMTCREALDISDAAIIGFYSMLGEKRDAVSDAASLRDSSWMADSDFCFINVRAAGKEDRFGTFLSASKLLPVIRGDSIHLGPFTSYDFGVIYAVTSVTSISYKVIDERLDLAGINGEEQLKMFVEACHMLGKKVGFDIEPHMAQFAMTVIMKPEIFRWYKIDGEKRGLENGLSDREMADEKVQKEIIRGVKEVREKILGENNIITIEEEAGDSIERLKYKEKIYHKIIKELIREGYWTIPSQAWNGRGIPGFAGYNKEGNHMSFFYKGDDGGNHPDKAYHILTPFKFYNGLMPNDITAEKPEPNREAIDFFTSIFNRWRDEFGFDFVRYDSVDHIFDSVKDESENYPLSDRPTPEVLRNAVENSKENGKPYIGNLAERMGNEIEKYEKLCFDLILGSDMMERIDSKLMEKSFSIYDRLVQVNAVRAIRFSMPFCVDTHDTGNPGLWGTPLVKVMGFERMRLRHFISRFISCGGGRRPKYEVMGSQDLSYGLYESNIRDINLVWVGDKEYNKRYHYLEDIYESLKGILMSGELCERYIASDYSWWKIKAGEKTLIAAASLEKWENTDSYNISISFNGKKYREYDFSGCDFRDKKAENGTIHIEKLPYLGFLLFESI